MHACGGVNINNGEKMSAPCEAVSLQVSSQEWLKEHGLDAAGLTVNRILASLGFQQRSGPVPALKHSVASRYCDGVFLQHPDSSGNVYNLVRAEEKRLGEVEERLVLMVDRLKERLKWLNSGSRKTFGVVTEQKVVLVLLVGDGPRGSQPVQEAVRGLLQEQGSNVSNLNIVSCGSQWQKNMVEISGDMIAQAIQWVLEMAKPTAMPTPHVGLGDAVKQILCQEEVDAIYLIMDEAKHSDVLTELSGKVMPSSVPLHVVCLDCSSPASLEECQQLATACGGRCYVNSSSPTSLSLTRPEVLAVWEELEKARDTLAEVQALRMEVTSDTPLHSTVEQPRREMEGKPCKRQTKEQRKKVQGVNNSRRRESVKKSKGKQTATPSAPQSNSGSTVQSSSGSVVQSNSGSTVQLNSGSAVQLNSGSPVQSAAGRNKPSIKRWLQKNSLVGQRLTLLDALGPSAIPHTPSPLDSKVYGKVFRDIFPLAHVSGDGHVTLLNPTGCDLKSYEQQLVKQKSMYSVKLDQLVWNALPHTVQQPLREEWGLGGGEAPSYQQHRQQLQSALAMVGWPVQEEELALLEEEIALADSFLRYSRALREERASPDPVHVSPPATTEPKQLKRTQMIMRGNKVLASCKHDGLYYQGTVLRCASASRAEVHFADGHCQSTLLNQLLVMRGSGSCPPLQVGDHTLCCVRGRQGWHCSQHGLSDFYVPSQVQAVPVDARRGHALYTVTTFSGQAVTCPRSALEKISETKYHKICEQIRRKEQQDSKQTQTAAPQVKDSHTNTVTCVVSSTTQTEEREGREVGVETERPPPQEDKDTNTVPLMKEEKGSSAHPSTEDQAVGTGPLRVDKSTVTSPTMVDESVGTGEEGTDFPDSPDPDLVGQSVLGRWPDDGWYYRATVRGKGDGDEHWILQTETGDMANIPTTDIITNEEDALHPIALHSPVLALHPSFSNSFAPAKVVSIGTLGCSVEFYDGVQEHLLRHEVYGISPANHAAIVEYILQQEHLWLGEAVVARRDSDGVYCPARVTKKLSGQCYEVQWQEGTCQEQSIVHVFGPIIQRRALHIGDHVIALAIPQTGVCLPGIVTGKHEQLGIDVMFSDGQSQAVPPEQCFWVTPEYYSSAVEYISRAFAADNDMSVDSHSQSTSCADITC